MLGDNPRILLTNDDGIHAEGLKVLEEVAREFSDDVWVVAPHEEQSGMSRALTLHTPLRVREFGHQRYSVSGTPTDCVLMAVQGLMEDKAPDLVLSGINHGQNMAESVTLSGTVAGAVQGMQLGIPSVAFSLAYGFNRDAKLRWDTARTLAPRVLRHLLETPWSENVIMNVNFPDRDVDDVAGIEATVQGQRDEHIIHADKREDLRGGTYYWLGFNGKLSNPPVGTDLRAIYEGRVSVTPLQLDLTHYATRDRLAEALHGDILRD